jgi:hypothetical protein
MSRVRRTRPLQQTDEAGPSEPSYTLACFTKMNQHGEACRSTALEYERAAEFATAAPVRRMYLDLARQWHDWAEQAERQAGKDLPLSAA